MRAVCRALEDFVFPRRAVCLGCGDKSGCEEDWLCARCAARLDALWVGERTFIARAPIARRAHARLYRDCAAELVRALKFGGATVLAEPMSRAMARAFAGLEIEGSPLVVPAPMHPRRERRRGYNQAELLSRALARKLDLPHAAALEKTRRTRQQARLNMQQRHKNLQGSMRARGDVAGRTILLVDDVYTSGATLHACALALRLAGAAEIYALTYAVAQLP